MKITNHRRTQPIRRTRHEPWKWHLLGNMDCSSCPHEFQRQQGGQYILSIMHRRSPTNTINAKCTHKGLTATHRTAVSSFDNQAQVRWQRSSISSSGSLLIRVRRRHIVWELPGALEHCTLIIRAIFVLNFFGHCLNLVHGVRDAD